MPRAILILVTFLEYEISPSGNFFRNRPGPGQVARLVGASSQDAKSAGWISSQGTYEKQPMMHKYAEQQIQTSLSLPLSLRSIIKKRKRETNF